MGTDPRDPRDVRSEDETIYDTRVLPRDRYREEEVVERRPPRRRPVLWPWLLALLVLVLVGIGALWYFTREETQPVPNTVGETLEAAVAELQDEGFRVEIEQRNDDSPEGRVFEQDPAGGDEAEEGSTVTIAVSQGPATAAVPDVVDALRDDAEAQLEDAGFDVNAVEVFSAQPEGQVVAQNPPAGADADVGSTVRINVSKGTGTVEVPDMVGENQADAQEQLRNLGLGANVVRVPSSEPAGTVVAQNPPAGSTAQIGGNVRLNVSAGQS
jgi:eukaryotic-like serine/threonine-protein kinase